MNQEKVGKFIAKLRKEQGLTQRELGDKVGIGYRSVSKWERGLTSPDISIINELSEILNVTSDELLKGERSNKIVNNNINNNTSFITKNKNKILIISIILIILIMTTIIIGIINNKTYVYNLNSIDDNYLVEGKLTLHKDQISIVTNKLEILDKESTSTYVKSYEYDLYFNGILVLRYGKVEPNNEMFESIDQNKTIEELLENFNIIYNDDNNILYNKRLSENKVLLRIKFLTEKEEIITKEINMISTATK